MSYWLYLTNQKRVTGIINEDVATAFAESKSFKGDIVFVADLDTSEV